MGEQAAAGGAAADGAAAAPPAAEQPPAGEQAEEREPLLERRYGTAGFAHASVFAKTTYTFVSPLLALGARDAIQEDTARAFLPVEDTAEELSARFDAAYARVKVRWGLRLAARAPRRRRLCPAAAAAEQAQQATSDQQLSRCRRDLQAEAPGASPSGLLWRTYWRLYRWRIAVQLAWNVAEIGARVGAPLVLRQLLGWLTGWEASGGDPQVRACQGLPSRGCCCCCPPPRRRAECLAGPALCRCLRCCLCGCASPRLAPLPLPARASCTQAYPVWRGWMWAGVLALFAYLYAIIHHQLFWCVHACGSWRESLLWPAVLGRPRQARRGDTHAAGGRLPPLPAFSHHIRRCVCSSWCSPAPRRYGMRMGLDMRQQAVAAVQAKVLRLNSVAVADQTAGKVRRSELLRRSPARRLSHPRS